ncbi:hypothetical protein LU642_28650 [Pseudomonas asiatica]|uniref:hypothetical protein n=1 Tax=Pseudomonas asiatica TaxID=2219225 RepID=UPI001E520F28|nr:hypothetical protein [Pseudomonas asiatica]MCE1084556.1 hypothetical protein [Pseudomonas asiatica]
MMEGISLMAQVMGETTVEYLEQQRLKAERFKRMDLAIEERRRQADLLQRRLARIEEALGLPPLVSEL